MPPSSAFDCPMREVGEAGGGRAPAFPLDLRGVLGHPSCRDITSRRSDASPLLQPTAVTPPSSAGSPPSEPENDKYAKRPVSRLANRLAIFPKTERDYTVRTERGVLLTGYAIMAMMMLAEWSTCGGRLIAIDWSTLSWIPGMCARLLFIFVGKENDSLGGGI